MSQQTAARFPVGESLRATGTPRGWRRIQEAPWLADLVYGGGGSEEGEPPLCFGPRRLSFGEGRR